MAKMKNSKDSKWKGNKFFLIFKSLFKKKFITNLSQNL